MKMVEILTWCATLLLLVVPTSLAQDGSTEDGVVVSAGAGKLSMKDQQGKEKSYTIDDTVKVTVNGNPGKLEDLTVGMQIRIVLDKDHKPVSVSTIDVKKCVAQT